jgi:hypothetical protein
MAGAMGFPFIRLRAALPEELLVGSVAQSLGRKDGMSLTGLEESRDENIAVMMQLRRSMSCFACSPDVPRKQIPAFDDNDRGSGKPLTPPRAQSLVHTSLMAAAAPYGGKPCVATFDYNDALSASDLEEYTRPADPNAMVGTALMFAFLANKRVLPVAELSIRLSAAREFFRGKRVPGTDHDFDSLLPKFMVLLGCEAGALVARAKWMQTARLWRMLLLQRDNGCFDLTDSLGFALEAHEGQPPLAKPKERKGLTALATLCLGDGDLEDDMDDAADETLDTDDEASPTEDTKQAKVQELRNTRAKDCPISFSAAAVRCSIPAALLELNSTYADPAMQRMLSRQKTCRGLGVPQLSERIREVPEVVQCSGAVAAFPESTRLPMATGVEFSEPAVEPSIKSAQPDAESAANVGSGLDGVDADVAPSPAATAISDQRFAEIDADSGFTSVDALCVPVERIWATLLSVQVLQGLDVSWLLDDEAEEGEERTIVDEAREWLEAQGKEDARVQALLDSGELAKAAEKTIETWKKVQEQNIAELRKADVLNRFTALTHIQRATGRVVKSLMTDHGASILCILRLYLLTSALLRAEMFATFLDADGYIMRWQRFSAHPAGIICFRRMRAHPCRLRLQ